MSKRKNKTKHRSPVVVWQNRESMTIRHGGREHTVDYCVPEEDIEGSYVYFVINNLELLYIGKGKGDRWKHTKQETSHNGFIRRAVKESCGESCSYKTYIVKSGLNDREALHAEKEWIRKLKPVGNIDSNPLYANSKKGMKRLRENMKSMADGKCDASKSISGMKKAKENWYKKNESRLTEELLDREHLNSLALAGRF
jgi:hypothetical protein